MNLLIRGVCETQSCAHDVPFYPASDGSSYYEGICANCGAKYGVSASAFKPGVNTTAASASVTFTTVVPEPAVARHRASRSVGS